jgi:hypothetical protein
MGYVYQSDGTQQREKVGDRTVARERAIAQLQALDIDGYLRPMMCGEATDRIYIFGVEQSKVEVARANGFSDLATLNDGKMVSECL